MTVPADQLRRRVLASLRRHGWNATSFQILEPGFSYAFHERHADVCVAYVDTGAAWVAAGAPIAPDHLLAEATTWFVERAARHGRRACFFAAEDRLRAHASTLEAVRIGELPVWDPRTWDESLRASRSLREQLRRARAKGVRVRPVAARELLDPSSPARRSIGALVERWLASRHMAPMGFLVAVETFAFADERRTYLAEASDGRVVAFLAAVPVYARGGWLFEDLVRAPGAPNGTAELLVDAAMRDVAAGGSSYATLGIAPLAGLVPKWMQLAGAVGTAIYDFRGVHAFKAKLRPRSWDAVWLAHPRGVPPSVAVYDALAAFARGSVPRFALESILRGPPVVVGALGVLLAPWTCALALADEHRWFPAHVVKDAWVAFDVVVAAGLLVLAYRWRQRLAVAIAVAITTDALVTATEALVWNARHVHGLVDVGVVAIACAAPTSAAFVMWRALARNALARRWHVPLPRRG